MTAKIKVGGEETLVVGDTTFDVEMGRAAGCHTCAVSYGSHDAERLATAAPGRIISRMGELIL